MIAIYTRASQDRALNNISTSDQEREIKRLIERLGWTEEVVIYSDTNISASYGAPRPAYNRMMADVKSGRVTKIGLHEASRLVRRPVEQEDVIDICEKMGIEFACVTGPIDLGTPTGRFSFRVQGAVSKQEGELKAERQKRAWAGKAERGEWHTGKHTFGYSVEGQVIPEQAAAIKRAYSDLMAGKSLRSVFRSWNDAGFTTTLGKAWVAKTCRDALLNPTIAGLSFYQGKAVGTGQWTAIITTDEQETLRKRLMDKSRQTNGGDLTRKHLLSHLLVCGCGGKTRADQLAAGRKVYKCYDCGRTINQGIADHVVDVWLGWFLGSPGAYEQTQSLMTSGDPERVTDINAELDQIAADEKALTESGASLNVILPMATKLQEQRAALQSELATLTQTDGLTAIISKLVQPTQPLAGVRAWKTNDNPQRVRETFSALPLEDRRRVLRSLATFTLLPPPNQGRLKESVIEKRVRIDPLV